MRLPEFAHTTAFRWTLALTAWFGVITLLIFAFIYWQTAGYERDRLDRMVAVKAALIARTPTASAPQVTAWLSEDLHAVRFAALVAPDGHLIAGNLARAPRIALDGVAREAVFLPAARPTIPEIVRAAGRRLPGGAVLVIGHDIDALETMRRVIGRALMLGLVPALLLSLGAGAYFAHGARRRIVGMNAAIDRITRGDLNERLPIARPRDDLDRLGAQVNHMLSEIERLVGEIGAVGDSMAHDLRTPLTRARTRLERSRDAATTIADFQDATDRAIAAIDSALTVVTAVLRIGHIEHGERRAAFASVELTELVREVTELYEPIAEAKAITLDCRAEMAARVVGDRDLLIEALVNLVDNGIKFTPEGGHVWIVLGGDAAAPTLSVSDDGPGMTEADRARATQRFYRAERSRSVDGSGLGLSLVQAIVALHRFELRLCDGRPGLRAEIVCVPSGQELEPAHLAARSEAPRSEAAGAASVGAGRVARGKMASATA